MKNCHNIQQHPLQLLLNWNCYGMYIYLPVSHSSSELSYVSMHKSKSVSLYAELTMFLIASLHLTPLLRKIIIKCALWQKYVALETTFCNDHKSRPSFFFLAHDLPYCIKILNLTVIYTSVIHHEPTKHRRRKIRSFQNWQ